MLHFLRKIRRNLINSGSMKKYTLYAIGEIALVVIGILIALQINNWNEERNEILLESKILKEMLSNLKGDRDDIIGTSEINGTLEFGKSLKSNIEGIIYNIENKVPYHDSLETSFGHLAGLMGITPNTSAFENLKSIGFDMIKEDSLRQKITNLYSEKYEYFGTIMNVFMDIQIEYLFRQVHQKISVDQYYQKGRPINAEALWKDQEFLGTLKTLVHFHTIMLADLNMIVDLVEDLILHMEKYLSSK
jgi:hypothetical protein